MSIDTLRKAIVAGDAKQVTEILANDGAASGDVPGVLAVTDPISSLTPLSLALSGTFQPVVAVILKQGGAKLLSVESQLKRTTERVGGTSGEEAGGGAESSVSADGGVSGSVDSVPATVQAVHVYCARFEAITEDEVMATGEALLEAGADFSVRSSDGRSCLHWVTENHHFGATICRFLLNRCSSAVSANDRDNDGFVPLHAAVISSNEAVFKMLVSAGCDIDVKSADGRSVLNLAERHSPQILSFLQQRGIGGPLPSPPRRPPSPKTNGSLESPPSRGRKAKRGAKGSKKGSKRTSETSLAPAGTTTTTTSASATDATVPEEEVVPGAIPSTSRLFNSKRDPRLLLELPPAAAARVALCLEPIELNRLCGVSKAVRAEIGIRNAAWYWNLVYYSCYHCANIFAWLHGSATTDTARDLDPEKYRSVFLTRARRAKRRARTDGSPSAIGSMCICCGYHRPRRPRTVYSYSIFSQAYSSLSPSLSDDAMAGNGHKIDYETQTWAFFHKDASVASYLARRTAIPTPDADTSVCAVLDDEADEDAELDEDDLFYNETRVSHSTRSDVS